MENKLQVFNNDTLGTIRTVMVKNEPWFVGKDVAEILGYNRPTKAIQDHVDSEDLDGIPIQDSIGRMQNTPIINESGLYSLVLSSRLPRAKEFKRWVTSEILPSLRKHGGYIVGQEEMTKEELVAKALIAANSILEEKEKALSELTRQIEADSEHTLLGRSVSTSDDCISIGELSKIIRQNGIDIGRDRLFRWMRDNGYLMKEGRDYNSPTQYSVSNGLLKLKEYMFNGYHIGKQSRVTGKGQKYFVNKFIREVM